LLQLLEELPVLFADHIHKTGEDGIVVLAIAQGHTDEVLRHALHTLAAVAPEWLRQACPPAWATWAMPGGVP